MTYKFFNPTTDPLMVGVDERVMVMADSAHEVSSQELPGVKYVITSGLRSPGGNSVLNGAVPDSSHLAGLALDLLVPGDAEFAAMMIGLTKAGFKRFGFYYVAAQLDPTSFIPRHIHIDIDATKPTPCIWTKKELN